MKKEILEKEKEIIRFIDISKNGYFAIAAASSIELWDLNTPQRLATFENFITQPRIKWVGERLLCKVSNKAELHVIENKNGQWMLNQTNIEKPLLCSFFGGFE